MEHAAHRGQRAKGQRKSIARMLGKENPNKTRPPGTSGIATATDQDSAESREKETKRLTINKRSGAWCASARGEEERRLVECAS